MNKQYRAYERFRTPEECMAVLTSKRHSLYKERMICVANYIIIKCIKSPHINILAQKVRVSHLELMVALAFQYIEGVGIYMKIGLLEMRLRFSEKWRE